MGNPVMDGEIVQRIVADALAPEEEQGVVERLMRQQPQVALSLVPVYLQQKLRYRTAAEEGQRAARELAAALQEPPWHPATVLRLLPGSLLRALVAVGGRRLAVRIGPGIDPDGLRCGLAVFLNQGTNVLVALAGDMPCSGSIGVFTRRHDGLAVLRGAGDEEIAVEVPEDLLAAGLREGDLLLYDRESRVATARVAQGDAAACPLEEPPDVRFEDIGGLDAVLEEIRNEVILHVTHRDLAASHRLPPARGIILYGPPGCGKTMIAKAIANFLSRQEGVAATYLNVRPGAHRSMWYGKTEENVRQLFASARRAAEGEGRFVVMLLDDMDHLGSRGDSVVTAVDARVLPAFLAEIDGLAAHHRVWLVGATNRPDLLDDALLRPGRFGDRLFRIPRPNREAARGIFQKHLPPDLPYHGVNGGDPAAAAGEMIEAALAHVYAPNGEAATLGTLVFRDGTRSPLAAAQVMSGALIAQAVAEAKRRSCLRAARGLPAGLIAADLLAGLDRQLRAVAQRLRPGPALRQMLELPQDLDVVKVELDSVHRLPATHEYLRSAERRS